MKYLLDTNVCIRHLNQRTPAITAKLRANEDSEIAVCSIIKGELLSGALKSQSQKATIEKQQGFLERFVSLPFDDAAVENYAQLRAELELAGTPIGAYDMMIAAIALTHDLILVTHNTKEFGRVTGLKIEDWETED